jgi:hypothetical protein
MNGTELNKNLTRFLRHIESIWETLPMTMLLIRPYHENAHKEYLKFIEKNVEKIDDENGNRRILVKIEEASIYEKLQKNATISRLASKVIPESLFVSLISQYDAFFSKLLRAIFEIKPEILNSSERNLTFSQLVEMQSIQEAREFIIEKEIDAVMRKSHAEQFDYLENKLSLKLREKLPIWKAFIEITERRNLFVHCDGVVSSQYIKVCKEHESNTGVIKIGDHLNVSPEYFSSAYKCLYEIAVKLTHTIWRKLLINDLKSADEEMNAICYELINSKAYNLADILLQFSCDQRKHFNDISKNLYIVNSALSKYLQNKKAECKTILDGKDWSACSYDFKLAYEILTDNYENAYSIMKVMHVNGPVMKENYKQWPLFTQIREEQAFKELYKEIFEEEFSILESPARPLEEIIKKEVKKKNLTNKKISSLKQINEN